MQELIGALVALAGRPASDPGVEGHLQTIALRTPQAVAVVDYAAVTVHRDGGHRTVAAGEELAPVEAPGGQSVAAWPQLRGRPLALGLHASVSIPLLAGTGVVANLDLYARDPAALTTLISRVCALYHPDPASAEHTASRATDGLGPDAEAFLAGLAAALDVQADIHRALGVLMAQRHLGVEDAYLDLQTHAVGHACSLHLAAEDLLARLP